eukprot:scaffold11.g4043.t1
MSLRRAAQGLAGRLARSGSQLQQRRFAGDLPVKQNKYVESWGTMREHVENDFRWDGRTLATLALFGGGVPYLIYQGCVREFNTVDEKAGRPKRDMWGSSSAAK